VKKGKQNIHNFRRAHLYALSSPFVLLTSWKISTSSDFVKFYVENFYQNL